jgi:hypothetical protein
MDTVKWKNLVKVNFFLIKFIILFLVKGLIKKLIIASNISKFDCIFIDGLHEYEQVKKDIQNSIRCLNNNGAILLHDCLPVSYAAQAVPRYKSSWNGDVWKAIVEVRTWGEVDVKTVLIDHGVSIIKKRKNTNLLKLNYKKFSNLKFKDFYHNYSNYLQIIDYRNIDSYY